ncbi:hypothetical protein ZWY2020_043663 [Hordeum vulgare]|nr:hypothetical protein ZWY2020_043663 [Hordeum vulgare]
MEGLEASPPGPAEQRRPRSRDGNQGVSPPHRRALRAPAAQRRGGTARSSQRGAQSSRRGTERGMKRGGPDSNSAAGREPSKSGTARALPPAREQRRRLVVELFFLGSFSVLAATTGGRCKRARAVEVHNLCEKIKAPQSLVPNSNLSETMCRGAAVALVMTVRPGHHVVTHPRRGKQIRGRRRDRGRIE